MLPRTDNQSPVSRPTPTGLDANDISHVDVHHLFRPKHQSDQSGLITTACGCYRPGVRRRDDHPLWIHTEHNKFKPTDGGVGSQIFNSVCGGGPVKSGWGVHGPATSSQRSSRSSLDFFRRTRKEEAVGSGSSAISSPPTRLLTANSYRLRIDDFGAFHGV